MDWPPIVRVDRLSLPKAAVKWFVMEHSSAIS
jgi:hypothetical protein